MMDIITALVIVTVQIFSVRCRMIVSSCDQRSPTEPPPPPPPTTVATATWSREHVMSLTNSKETKDVEADLDEYETERQRVNDKISSKKPCSIIVLSNIQNPGMQSLLRKYRYDARGMLIPSSVKYFFKLPQGLRTSPLLVPLNDKAFSPLGGFVRYYKEVPPIPHSW